MPATPLDLALFCLAVSVVAGWLVWVAIPWLVDQIAGNWLVACIVWPLIFALAWPVLAPLIHALTA
ncbi:hypothetical protein [Zoogloea sp.]|uniref:hypothetical protein n=1 Tax=Zoogloea sp. TaxID=49181 RepID=UPI002636FB20|nr:hypothetical protein [Zoogloea sp.]